MEIDKGEESDGEEDPSSGTIDEIFVARERRQKIDNLQSWDYSADEHGPMYADYSFNDEVYQDSSMPPSTEYNIEKKSKSSSNAKKTEKKSSCCLIVWWISSFQRVWNRDFSRAQLLMSTQFDLRGFKNGASEVPYFDWKKLSDTYYPLNECLCL